MLNPRWPFALVLCLSLSRGWSGAWQCDLDRSGLVDERDLFFLMTAFDQGVYSSAFDLNGDLRVDGRDLLEFSLHWREVAVSTPTPTMGTIQEQEPNDTLATAQNLGSLAPGRSLQLSGRLSSGGMQGEDYTGDFDVFRFTLPAQAGVSLSTQWTGTADVDMVLIARNAVLVEETGAARPITLAGTLSDGTFYLALASKDAPADYQIVLTGSPPNASYANSVALVDGKYQTDTGTVGFQQWYLFNGAGHYQYWNWSFLSGDMLMHEGAYAVWFPFLLLEHDGTVEAYLLEWSQNGITLNGTYWGRI